MLLKELVLKNFKSFKTSTIKIAPGVTAIVGPNGSGKSNVVDSIRFVFGEKRLKKLRAKKVSDLIHVDERSASVLAVLEENNNFHEIKRSIRKDGKIKYELNGKRLNLSALKEFLRRKGIKAIDTFVIAQGEITRITLMNPKERRLFIDEISGIAEFEEKKKEALRELELVDSRIKETNIVIGEKLKYLEQLKAEKELAEKYESKKKRLDNIRATLISKSISEIESKLEAFEKKQKELSEKKEFLSKKLEEISSKISDIYKNRELLDKEIEAKTKRSEIYRKLEDTKTKRAVIEEKMRNFEENLNSLNSMISEKKEEMDRLDSLEDSIKSEISNLEKVVKNIKIKKISSVERKSVVLRKELENLEKELSQIEKSLELGKQRYESLKSSLEDNEKVVELLEAEEIDATDFEKELKEIEKRNIELFKKERSLNNQLADKDRRIIKIREKLAILRASVGNLRVNPIEVFLSDLVKNGKLEGFYGKAIDLIEFDEKFANAIEAAAGNRLTYFVVDSLETAKKAIDYIKKMKLGRATFIPLQELRVTPSKDDEMLVKNVVSVSLNLPGIEKIPDFLFSDTILVDSFSKAKAFVGKKRVVTLEGELFERSAIVSGGRGKGTLTAKKAIESLEAELNNTINERKSIVGELSSLREEISSNRSRKTYLENKMKELESMKKEMEKKAKRKQELIDYIKKAESEMVKLKTELDEYSLKREKLLPKIKSLKEELEKELKLEEEVFGKELSEREKKIREKISAEESIKANLKKLEEIKATKIKFSDELKSLSSKQQKLSKELRKYEDEYRILSSEMVQLEEEFSRKEEEIKELVQKGRELEEELRELSKKDKLLRDGIASAEKVLHKIEVENASLTTKYEDLKEEISKYPDFVVIDLPKEKLSEELSQLESELSSMGEINFAAKELYYKLYDEVGEIKEKLDRLKLEKDKIIELISEIDERKKESFFTHLEKINKNFKELFRNISNFGEGSLFLDKPEEPFESGLNMKLIRNEREIPLESLSGGEQTIMSLLFIFALQSTKPSPFYVLDEIDAALDKLNSQRMAELIKNFSKNSQIILISHNDILISNADTIIGITKSKGYSKAVHLKSEMLEKKN